MNMILVEKITRNARSFLFWLGLSFKPILCLFKYHKLKKWAVAHLITQPLVPIFFAAVLECGISDMKIFSLVLNIKCPISDNLIEYHKMEYHRRSSSVGADAAHFHLPVPHQLVQPLQVCLRRLLNGAESARSKYSSSASLSLPARCSKAPRFM